MLEAEQIMKRCQIGTRNYEEANNLHAECYRIIGKLLAERTWVGLTDEEIDDLAEFHGLDFMSYAPFTRAIEAKLKDKNGYAKENI